MGEEEARSDEVEVLGRGSCVTLTIPLSETTGRVEHSRFNRLMLTMDDN
jgi:hypothetical protein